MPNEFHTDSASTLPYHKLLREECKPMNCSSFQQHGGLIRSFLPQPTCRKRYRASPTTMRMNKSVRSIPFRNSNRMMAILYQFSRYSLFQIFGKNTNFPNIHHHKQQSLYDQFQIAIRSCFCIKQSLIPSSFCKKYAIIPSSFCKKSIYLQHKNIHIKTYKSEYHVFEKKNRRLSEKLENKR